LKLIKIADIEKISTVFAAAELGQVDLIINPKDTRNILMRCLEPLLTKREEKFPENTATFRCNFL